MNLLRRKSIAQVSGYRHSPTVTIRWATPADAPKLNILADVDEDSVPPAPLLLAFVGDELWVALSLFTGAVISDPFRPTAEVAGLARERGRQLTVPDAGRPRAGRRRLRTRWPEPHEFDARTLTGLGGDVC
jgi:hypothetical protein